jgi:hypothetical protein
MTVQKQRQRFRRREQLSGAAHWDRRFWISSQ